MGPRPRALLQWYRDHDLTDLTAEGEIWTMRGNEDSGEWWLLALEYVAPILVELGTATQEQVDGSLAQARAGLPCCPLSIAVRGRKPR